MFFFSYVFQNNVKYDEFVPFKFMQSNLGQTQMTNTYKFSYSSI